MGFTAVEGLPMGTRSGSLDPGVLLFLFDEIGLSVRDIERLLYHESGLLGMSGLSSDMRELLASDDAGGAAGGRRVRLPRASRTRLARRGARRPRRRRVHGGHRREPAGGAPRASAPMRGWLGVELDEAANGRGEPRISAPGSRVAAYVVPTDEELMIARHVAALLG